MCKEKSEKEYEKEDVEKDIEALKGVLNVLVDFLRNLKGPLADIINTVLSTMRGEELGEDVGAFYRKLVESGVPEKTASELARRYLEERLAISKIVRIALSEIMRGRKVRPEEIRELIKVSKELESEENERK